MIDRKRTRLSARLNPEFSVHGMSFDTALERVAEAIVVAKARDRHSCLLLLIIIVIAIEVGYAEPACPIRTLLCVHVCACWVGRTVGSLRRSAATQAYSDNYEQ